MSNFARDGLQLSVSAKWRLCGRTVPFDNRLVCIFAVALVTTLWTQVGNASDKHVLGELFDEPTIGQNVLALRERVADLSDDERYQTLSEWVLPGDGHLHFRLEGAYTPTNAAPSVVLSELNLREQADTAATGEHVNRVQVGGELVAPAFDLVDIAEKLGRLNDLRKRVSEAETDDALDARSKLSLLFLIELADGDVPTATAVMTKLFDAIRQSNHSLVSERWPETLAMTRGVRYTPRIKIADEFLYLIYEKFVNDLNDWRGNGNEVWDTHFFALLGMQRLRESEESVEKELTGKSSLKNWAAASTFYARTRGKGLPHHNWNREGQRVSHVSGHHQDYLVFRSPLTGNFEIECEVTSPLWRKIELLVANRWIEPHWGPSAFEIGRIRWQMSRIPLDPPRARLDEWTRFRAIVRDGNCTIFYNGRKIHEEQIPKARYPWIAVRSDARNLGTVRNIRIAGNPNVAETVNLALHNDLPGWTSYQQRSVTKEGYWYLGVIDGDSCLIGNRKSELAGSFCESLLVYNRPMLEDGTIDYEFYYEPGQTHVSPAIDRLAFLLDQEGVNIHWVTDGEYDRTLLGPDNRSTEATNRQGEKLPLEPQAWNRLRFTLRGDTVFLELNGEAIYERLLEATNQRTFGLFHYSDQTEARVRNLVWRGDWPKQIPKLHDQELFIPDHECLADLDSLTEVFSHKFTDELGDGEIAVGQTYGNDAISRYPDGLKVAPPVRDQWTGIKLSYQRPIYGDFDATLRFSDLKMTYKSRGTSDQMLIATDDSGIAIGCARTLSADYKNYATAAMTLPLPDGKKRYITKKVSDEAGEGTLRLVRRGSTVYSLIAHGDSKNFRHVGNFELPSAASSVLISTTTNLNGGGTCEAVLKELTVRSNTTAFEQQIDARVSSLNQYTALLPKTYRHGFAASGTEGFAVVGEFEPVKTNGGLRVRAGNDPRSGGSTLSFGRKLNGDFDLSATLNATELVVNESQARTVSMSVRNENETATIAIKRSGAESFDVSATVQRMVAGKSEWQTVASTTVPSVDSLRLVRIQKTILFVYSEAGLSRLLGQANFDSTPVANGGAQLSIEPRSGEVLWKSFEAKMSSSSK